MEDRLQVAVVRMGLGCAAVLAATGWAGAQPVALPPAPAGVEVTREQGFEFVTVRGTGAGYPNSTAAWTGSAPWQEYQGRGIAAQPFRISRTEVDTGSWLQFLQTFSERDYPADVNVTMQQSLRNTFYWGPIYHWGATYTIEGNGSTRTTWSLRDDIPNAPLIPVFGLSWRSAAMYCNWLHNGRSSEWSALFAGAYDTTTWGWRANGTYTDAVTRSPGARFFIPTEDEWTMASFWDPNRHGVGQGGFWQYVNGSDRPPVPGFPDEPGAETSAGIPITRNLLAYTALGDIPVGAYPRSQSPWGLLDTSGGVEEWTEGQEGSSVESPEEWNSRRFLGATSGSYFGPLAPPGLNNEVAARIFAGRSGSPGVAGSGYVGLRIAAAVPSPSSFVSIVVLVFFVESRLNRRRSIQ